MTNLSPTDPLLSRANELLTKHLRDLATLWIKPPGDTPKHHVDSRFWQPWYPEHQRLLAAGWKASESRESWPQIAIFGARQKEENRNLLEWAQNLLADEGTIFFVVPNEYGSKSYQKELTESGVLKEHFTGRKSRLYVLSPDAEKSDRVDFQVQNKSELKSVPGLFSWEKADRGSRLLAESLADEQLKSPICDLGAGWGYLASQLPKTNLVHLVEADFRGLQAARENLTDHQAEYLWADATDLSTLPKTLIGNCRNVITNPPFHTHKSSDPVLGGAFVATAHKLLGKGGALYLVGNAHLPYKRVMEAFFPRVEEIARKDGYIVHKGVK